MCELRLAVGSGKSAKDPTVYIDVAAFEKTAHTCAEHLAKGREVGVTGRLVYREWTGTDGTKRSRHSVVATRVEFGSRPRDEGYESQEAWGGVREARARIASEDAARAAEAEEMAF